MTDFALRNLQAAITIIHHCQAMGYEYYCLVPTGKDIGKQALLGLRIEGACCFIEQHDGTVAKQCPGYTDALCLSLAQSSTLL